MSGLGKKPPVCVPRREAAILDRLSKAALMDIAWNLALLGTDESTAQTFAHVCREAARVGDLRGDAVPIEIRQAGQLRIDSDPSEEFA